MLGAVGAMLWSFIDALLSTTMALFMKVVELDVVPDFILRRGMRLLLAKRIADVRPRSHRWIGSV